MTHDSDVRPTVQEGPPAAARRPALPARDWCLGGAAVLVAIVCYLLVRDGPVTAAAASEQDGPSALWPVLSLVCGLLAWAVGTRGRRGDVLSPFSITLLVLISIYAVRPLFMLHDRDFEFYGLDVVTGFDQAAFVGFAGILALSAGYFFPSRARTAPSRTAAPAPGYSMYRAGLVGTGLVLAWLVANIVKGGSIGFLTQVFAGRSASTGAALAGLPVVVAAFPVASALLVATVRILIERQRRLRATERIAFWSVVVLAVLPALGQGGRRFLLPCLVASIVATTAPSYGRVVRPRLAVAAFVAFALLAVVPFVRTTGSRQGRTDLLGAVVEYVQREGLIGTLRPVFTSYDTEMFSYVSYLAPRLGNGIPYGLGRGTVGDALLAPFPAGLAPAPLWSNELLTSIFGGGCTEVVCPVPSVLGVLLYDLALPGVLVGCLLLGLLFRRYPSWLASANAGRLVLVVALAAFAPVLARGNTINTGYLTVLTCLVCLAGLPLARRRRSRGGDLASRPPGLVGPSRPRTAAQR